MAEKPGIGRQAVCDLPAGGHPVEIVIPRGLVVTGIVLRPERKPAEGAEAVLAPRASRPRPALAVGES